MTSPLSPEAVAQMVATLREKAPITGWWTVADNTADMLTTLAAENATLRASEAAAMERVKVLELALRYCGVSDQTPGGIIRCAAKAVLTPTADKEPKT